MELLFYFMRRPCGGPFKAPVIHVDGRVTVCCKDVSLELCIGNINEKEFEDIWFSEKAERIRKAHINGDLSQFPRCLHCNNLDAPIMTDTDVKKYLEWVKND